MPLDLTPEHHAQRAKVVGASEVAALFGCQQPYQMSLFTLWHVKAGNIAPPPVEGPRIDWGNDLEEAIARVAARKNKWTITKGEHTTDPTTPGLGCTLDYTIEAPDPESAALGFTGPGALEIKNVDWLQHRQKWEGDEPPLHILLQHQHQFAATGYTWGVVAALIGGNDIRFYRYAARPALIADIRRRVTAFWQSIADNKPPPVDGSDGAFYALRDLVPEIVDDAVCMDGDNRFPALCAELASATAARKEIEEREAALKAELEQKLGEHKRAWCDGWNASFVINKGSAGTLVTPEMVGTFVGARKGSRYVKIKETTK